LTRAEVVRLAAIVASVTHFWTIINMLVDVPAWILQMNLVELAGAVSYSLVYSLAETFLVLAVLLGLGLLIPSRFRQDNFLLWAALLFLWTGGLALAVSGDPTLAFKKQWLARVFLLTYLPLAAGMTFWPAAKRAANWLADQLAPLAWLYLALDGAGLLIVLLRNI
jgi:hypothetical protein